MADLPPLSDGQLEIMTIIWDREEATVAEVWKALAGRRGVARNTVQTLMARLEEKGWLLCRDEGHAFRYRAARPRGTTLGAIVGKLVDNAFGGSAEGLVHALIDGRGVSKDEAARIKAMIERAEGRGESS